MIKQTLTLPDGDLPLPCFLPDATRAVVRSVDSADLEACGVSALVIEHLSPDAMQHPLLRLYRRFWPV